MKNTIKTYTELIQYYTFEERLNYLKLNGVVSETTFGCNRYINQNFYRSKQWKRIRREIIIRDKGCDLGVDGYEIHDKIIVHHMNPITERDIIEQSEYLLNPEYLICVSHDTHNIITYDMKDSGKIKYQERRPNDTSPWLTERRLT